MNKRSISKMASIGMLVLILVLMPIGAVHAADFDEDGVIGTNETIQDDVFLNAETCKMDGTVDGNLVAACQTITVTGAVTGDAFLAAEVIEVEDSAVIEGNLFAFAAKVVVDGSVDGTVVSAAQLVLLDENANVARNAYLAGYETHLNSGAVVGIDMYSAGNQVIVEGDVARDLGVGAGAFELSGTIGRNAHIEVGSPDVQVDYHVYMPSIGNYFPDAVPTGIRFFEGASIGNDLVYFSYENVDDELSASVAGSVEYNEQRYDETFVDTPPFDPRWVNHQFAGFRLSSSFSRLLTYFALGALAFWLCKNKMETVKGNAFQYPLKSFGWGLVAILVGFMAIFLIPGTFLLIGVLLGFLSLGGLLYAWFGVVGAALVLGFAVFFLAVFTLSKVVAAYALGSWLMDDLFKAKTSNRWINLLIGVLTYVILRAIPIAGGVIGFAATLFGTGVLVITYTNVEKKKAVEE